MKIRYYNNDNVVITETVTKAPDDWSACMEAQRVIDEASISGAVDFDILLDDSTPNTEDAS